MPNVTDGKISPNSVRQALRKLCTALFVSALAGLGTLLLYDIGHHFGVPSVHQHLAAFPLVLIGLSYVCLQLSATRPRGEMLKGLSLGIAFVLWGCEQLLPATRLTTVMDGMIIMIFVVDLSLIIVEHLRRRDHDLP